MGSYNGTMKTSWPPLTFVDLFAGVGGFHLAMHNLGAKCVFAAEWDNSARKTYQANFGEICPELFQDAAAVHRSIYCHRLQPDNLDLHLNY